MATPDNTRIYLACRPDEDVSELLATDSRLVALRLVSQTLYGAGEAFRHLTAADIPAHIQYVGFITPDFAQKTGRALADIQHPGDANTLAAFQRGGMFWHRYTYLPFAVESYPLFGTLWAWLLGSLGLNPYTTPYGRRHIYDHMWLADRGVAIEFMTFARKAMDLLDSAPAPIQILLYTDTKCKVAPATNMGIPYVTYHSLILERCIMLFCDLKKIRVV
jgi:hypothetical protein